MKKFEDLFENEIREERLYFTGSRSFGVEKESSDYDYIVFERNFYDDIFDWMKKNKLKHTSDDKGYHINFKFELNFRIYNIILLSFDNFNMWVYATKQIQKLCFENHIFKKNIKNKSVRITVFEKFLSLKQYFMFDFFAEETRQQNKINFENKKSICRKGKICKETIHELCLRCKDFSNFTDIPF